MPEPTRRNRGRLTRRQFVVAGAAIGGAALSPADALLLRTSRVFASVSQAQTPLPSANITKYVTALRTFNGHRVESSSFTSRMVEFQQVVLPPSMYPSGFKNGTWLWGYQSDGQPASWPGARSTTSRGARFDRSALPSVEAEYMPVASGGMAAAERSPPSLGPPARRSRRALRVTHSRNR